MSKRHRINPWENYNSSREAKKLAIIEEGLRRKRTENLSPYAPTLEPQDLSVSIPLQGEDGRYFQCKLSCSEFLAATGFRVMRGESNSEAIEELKDIMVYSFGMAHQEIVLNSILVPKEDDQCAIAEKAWDRVLTKDWTGIHRIGGDARYSLTEIEEHDQKNDRRSAILAQRSRKESK